MKKLLKYLLYFIFLILLSIGIYALTTYIFTLFPKKPINHLEQNKKIYILYNDFHSDIVFNIKELNMSKFPKFKNKKFGYLSFGWGDKETYLNTPDIKNIKISTTLKALFINSPSLMHVSYIRNIRQYKDVKTIKLSKEQQKVLKKSILNTFNFQEATYKGYGKQDIFYTAKGDYNFINTCNTWTGDKLREANVSMSYWTPISWSVTTDLP